MSITPERATAIVTGALVAVLEVDPATVGPALTWDEVRADSLALMEIVEIVEAQARAEADPSFHITDPEIDDLPTVGSVVARLVRG